MIAHLLLETEIIYFLKTKKDFGVRISRFNKVDIALSKNIKFERFLLNNYKNM